MREFVNVNHRNSWYDKIFCVGLFYNTVQQLNNSFNTLVKCMNLYRFLNWNILTVSTTQSVVDVHGPGDTHAHGLTLHTHTISQKERSDKLKDVQMVAPHSLGAQVVSPHSMTAQVDNQHMNICTLTRIPSWCFWFLLDIGLTACGSSFFFVLVNLLEFHFFRTRIFSATHTHTDSHSTHTRLVKKRGLTS